VEVAGGSHSDAWCTYAVPDTSWIASVLPVASALAGFAAAALNDARKDRRLAGREREARMVGAIERWTDKRQAFERDTLLALQDELYKLMRCVGRLHFHDEQAYRTTGVWGRARLDEDLDQAFTEAITTVDRLRVRVFDAVLRDAVLAVQNAATHTGIQRSNATCTDGEARDASEAAHAELDARWASLEPRLGVAIRAAFERPGVEGSAADRA
jgi:hypothetical protein